MSFKIHLIIVCAIIIVVFFSWQLMSSQKSTEATGKSIETISPYSVSIIHATWGINCRDYYAPNTATKDDPFKKSPDSNSKLREDNVLEAVSKLCSGKLKCSIPINEKALGSDPAPDCSGKVLKVEYRCFSFDRPWIAESDGKKLDIDCSKAEERVN